jgi:hypothetical protein
MANDGVPDRVSSPTSSGGGGTTFEQHVGAYWLAQLLTGAHPPVLIDAVVNQVHFQTEYLGWNTDDLLVICDQAGRRRCLAIQVKLSFTVSSGDEECVKAFRDFWLDYRSPGPMQAEDDRFVLVVSRGTERLLKHFAGLLEAARAAPDALDFEQRLNVTGFLSKIAHRFFKEIQTIVEGIEGRTVGAADLWPFLRLMHVMSLDLHNSTRQTESHIRTLLAYSARGSGDPRAIAQATWHHLVALASEADTARSYSRAELPASLLEQHDVLPPTDWRVLRRLEEHSQVVLQKVESTIGPDLHLSRSSLLQRVLEQQESNQVVLIVGPAGSGKSALAKEAVLVAAGMQPTFAFRAEEFAQPHLDTALGMATGGYGTETLRALLGAHPRVVILVESVERLLEARTRDAFGDLVDLVKQDTRVRLVLTCRDYSAELVRTIFLQAKGIDHGVVDVPPLDDDELRQVQVAVPALSRPLSSPPLRRILRNPYFLGQALRIQWAPERPLPESEREFRILFWREIIRAEGRAPGGMPRLREEAFVGVALRRARTLLPYVHEREFDTEAVAALRADALLESPNDSRSHVAPAHDALEDWAILHWLDQAHRSVERSIAELSGVVGPHPAVRRSYRAWVAELIARDAPAAERLFRSALDGAGASAQFRDDTLVAFMRAPTARDFLERHETRILGRDHSNLRRLIHLLRVACVRTADWAPAALGAGGAIHFSVPDGPAWSAILRLVQKHIEYFEPSEYLLLVGLIEDAVRDVTWQNPRMEAEDAVAAIAYKILPAYDHWNGEDARKRVLAVIAKVPLANREQFASLLGRFRKGDDPRDRAAEELQDLVLSDPAGFPAARDLPDVVASAARGYLMLDEGEVCRWERMGTFLDLGPHFGLQYGHRREFFPPSALRGPWLALLRHHPHVGLDLLVDVCNQSIDWYVHPRVPQRLEPAWEVAVELPGGEILTHWVNDRLWNIYRGHSVSPYPLQSLLMALEKWLLEYARDHQEDLDSVLLELLRRCESGAVAAVVASVATSQPHQAGETLLALLSAPDYVLLDRRRMAGERSHASLADMGVGVEDQIHQSERREANVLPHRKHDLEAAIANLQLGPHRPRVQARIDAHLSALPSESEQTEEDLVWRLALHRMDLRQYRVASADPDDDDGAAKTIALELTPPAPELQALSEESAAQMAQMNERLGVLLWGMAEFEGRNEGRDSSAWRTQIARAESIDRGIDCPDGGRGGPGYVAAVAVRDHWNEMSAEEQEWCVEVVCSEVLNDADRWGELYRMQRYAMAGDRPTAAVLPMLLLRSLPQHQEQQVRDAFAAAFTHPVDEVRAYAASGINEAFWAAEPATALRCVDVIAADAIRTDAAWRTEAPRRFGDHRSVEEIQVEVRMELRKRFWDDGSITGAHQRADPLRPFAAHAWPLVLSMLAKVPGEPVAVEAFKRAATALAAEWEASRWDGGNRQDRNYLAEAEIEAQLCEFLMRTGPEEARRVVAPIVDSIGHHSREVYPIIDRLRGIEDRQPNTEQFWFLWSLFADAVKNAPWVGRLNDRHPSGVEFVAAIFMTTFWNDHVRHWRSLEGHAHRVHALFEALPPSATVFEAYVRFLYHIGERELPQSFHILAQALRQGDAEALLHGRNTVFLVEMLLQRHVYGRPRELKQDPELREAVLLLLDCLVEAGSSAAFRMRDDFVTPMVEA